MLNRVRDLLGRLKTERVRMLIHKKKFLACLGVVIVVIGIGTVGKVLTPSPGKYYKAKSANPSWEHPLGTDRRGRDIFAVLTESTQNSLLVGAYGSGLALAIGFVIGGIGAYKGGLLDESLNMFSNIILVFPLIPLLILVALMFKSKSLWLVGTLIALFVWPNVARTIRGQVLSLKERRFVDLARISGKSDSTILLKEIFPNMLAYIFIKFFATMGGVIITESGLSLIGLGPTRTPTLGLMLNSVLTSHALQGRMYMFIIPPGLVIMAVSGALIMMGSTIDEILNPRLRGIEI